MEPILQCDSQILFWARQDLSETHSNCSRASILLLNIFHIQDHQGHLKVDICTRVDSISVDFSCGYSDRATRVSRGQ